jgi:hypothetical protein
MGVLIKNGGLGSGGINFDAKLRCGSGSTRTRGAQGGGTTAKGGHAPRLAALVVEIICLI